jgi:hypothetical protein
MATVKIKAAKTKRPRPKMPLASEEMKQWSAMLEKELSALPKVTSRPMFGMRGFYRGKKIFAALPVTRGFGTPNQFIFRIKPMPPELLQRAKAEPRMDLETRTPSAKWFTFAVNSAGDLRDALWWLNQAYDRAKGSP